MKLIKINTDHYVVVDDSEIQEGDWYIDDTNRIRQAVMGDGRRCKHIESAKSLIINKL